MRYVVVILFVLAACGRTADKRVAEPDAHSAPERGAVPRESAATPEAEREPAEAERQPAEAERQPANAEPEPVDAERQPAEVAVEEATAGHETEHEEVETERERVEAEREAAETEQAGRREAEPKSAGAKHQPEAPGPEPAGEAPAPETKRAGVNRYEPPATLGHLETTPPDQRSEIDDLIAVMFDPESGRDALDAKQRLVAIGKPAFLPVLGRMAALRDTLKDEDTMDERIKEATLMLADQCLREMDGFLDAKNKQMIRPGTDTRYVRYILILHYRRWLDGLGSTALKDMDEMPGPFDPEK